MSYELYTVAGVAFAGGVLFWAAVVGVRGRVTLRRLRIGERVVHVTPMPALEERAFDAETFAAAITEQYRREAAHPGPRYRADQRVRAVQQRLSRKWGAAAFTTAMKRRVEEALSP